MNLFSSSKSIDHALLICGTGVTWALTTCKRLSASTDPILFHTIVIVPFPAYFSVSPLPHPDAVNRVSLVKPPNRNKSAKLPRSYFRACSECYFGRSPSYAHSPRSSNPIVRHMPDQEWEILVFVPMISIISPLRSKTPSFLAEKVCTTSLSCSAL